MGKIKQLGLMAMLGILSATLVFAQGKQLQIQRRPAADTPAKSEKTLAKASGRADSYYILNGLPMLLELHHDTEVGTNKPVDVYLFVIEMQVMNSDGDREPIGLQIGYFYTKWPQEPAQANNPHNARDCKTWSGIQTRAMKNRDPKIKTWPYVEFVTDVDARVLQTNEDGAVLWSDDIECWGSTDRFPPF
jgi:hypothetical protein